MKTLKFLVAGLMALQLSACSEDTQKKSNSPVFTQAELEKDQKSLEDAEKGLGQYTFKFKITEDEEKNEVKAQWDTSVMDSKEIKSHVNESGKALNYYSAIAQGYLIKYTKRFTLIKADGKSEDYQLKTRVRATVEAKKALVEQTVPKINEL